MSRVKIPTGMVKQRHTADMASFRKNVTGLDNTIFIMSRPPERCAPHIEVAVDPPTSIDPADGTASVSFHGHVMFGDLPAEVLARIREFLALNQSALLDYWHLRIDTHELRQRLKAV